MACVTGYGWHCIAAYVLGPLAGAAVGASVNIIYGFLYGPIYIAYALTSVIIGLLVGHFARQKVFDTLFGTLSVAFCITIISMVVGVPINLTFFDGHISNIWGDGVIDYFLLLGMPRLVCYCAGQFYMDFLDKTITFLILFGLLKQWRKNKGELMPKISKLQLVVLAGMKLEEMIQDGRITPDQAKIGYVGAYPYPEVMRKIKRAQPQPSTIFCRM